MNKNGNLLFFTYADRRYSLFALPYAYFALRNNPDSIVEICLEDYDCFFNEYADGIAELEKIFPHRALFRQAKCVLTEPMISPNTVRFVETALSHAKYLYIGDIDLLIFDNVCDIHCKLMEKHKIPFSNIIRPSSIGTASPKLTGLHFINYENYYPLPNISDIDLAKANDEYVLYEITRRKGLAISSEFKVRPECGIHMSLNRDPIGRSTGVNHYTYSSLKTTSWGGRGYYHKFLKQIRESSFLKLFPYLNIEFRTLLLVLEALATKKSRLLHRIACAFLLDKRFVIQHDEISKYNLYKSRDALILDKNYEGALSLAAEASLIWVFSPDVWHNFAYSCFLMGKHDIAIEALYHVLDLPGGFELLRQSNIININYSNILNASPEGVALLNLLKS